MGVLTARLKLRKPNIGDAPLITDLDRNWDILDNAAIVTNNGSDFSSMPSTRLNLKVPMLSSAVAVATTNVSALNTYMPVIDGVTVYPGMQVLLTAQTNAKQNGPWMVSNGPGFAWTRPLDFATGFKLGSRLIGITGGTYAGQVWQLSTMSQLVVDTDAQTWVNTSLAGVAAAVAASQGAWNVVAKTTAYTASAWDYVLADTTSATFAVTAPTPVAGKQWGIRWKAGSVAPTLSGTFDAAPTFTAVTQAMEFIADGTTWYRNVRPALAQLPDYPALTDARYGRSVPPGTYSVDKGITGTTALAETFSRRQGTGTGTPSGMALGQVYATSIELPAGMTINRIAAASYNNAGTTTHVWFGIADNSYNVVALTADDTTNWGSFAGKNLSLTSPYTTPTAGLYYLLCMVAGTVMPNFWESLGIGGSQNNSLPYLFFNDGTHTGLTTPSTCPSVLTPNANINGPMLYMQVL